MKVDKNDILSNKLKEALDFKRDMIDRDSGIYRDVWKPTTYFKGVGRKYGEAEIKRDVVLSAWKNYCRESFIYRVLEFLRLR